jgi:hypothetical protein
VKLLILCGCLLAAIGLLEMDRGYHAHRQGLGQFLGGAVSVVVGLVLTGVAIAYSLH